MSFLVIYNLLIRGINVSDFHIIVIFNDYYTLIVAFLTKQIENRNRNSLWNSSSTSRGVAIMVAVTYTAPV